MLASASLKWPGSRFPTLFPRLTYAQAMRSYGIDKPDLRLPPFHLLGWESWQLVLGLTFPPVAIHIPKTGQLSRKERDELKAFRDRARAARL